MSPHTPDIAFGQPLETQIDVPRARDQPLEAKIPGISLPAEAMRHGKNRVISENTRKRYIQEEYGGRYKIRTCDPFRVREVRYHCANRPGHPQAESIILNQPSESGQRDSNPRSQPWQGCALPTKLCPRFLDQRHAVQATDNNYNDNHGICQIRRVARCHGLRPITHRPCYTAIL